MAEVGAAAPGAIPFQRRAEDLQRGGGRFLPPRNLETRIARDDGRARRPDRTPAAVAAAVRAYVNASVFVVHLLASDQSDRGSPASAPDSAAIRQALGAYRVAGTFALDIGEEDVDGILVSRGPSTLDIRA